MNKLLTFIIAGILSQANLVASAQIIHPDTTCLNTTVNLSAPANGTYYNWQINNAATDFNINTLPVNSPVIANANASWTTIQRDLDGNWYGFYTYAYTGTVHKLAFGNSPLNTPADIIIGSYNTSDILQGIDIVYDKVNNSWFGFTVGGTNLVVLNFGSSLGDTPTNNIYNFPGNFSFPHQIGVKKFDNSWVGFIADRNGSIVRLDFPLGLNTQPIATNLPTANYSSPCNFALYQANANWYMIVPSLLDDNSFALLNFGSDIKNNAPISTPIGGQISNITIPRSLNLFSNCSNSGLYLYVTNEGGGFTKLDFNGQITNNVTATTLGDFSEGGGVITNFVYDNTVYGLKVCSNGTIGKVAMFDLPTASTTKYADETLTQAFTQTGEVSLRAIVDPGLVMGTSSYCDQMFAKDCNVTSINSVAPNAILLDQNIPNPSSGQTTINIHINEKYKDKMIVLKDQVGRQIHTYHLTNEDHVTVDLTSLQPGIYYYSLLVEGQILSTKKMVVDR
jgi:hypothetical protein